MYPELRLPLVVALAAALAFVAFLVLGRPVLRRLALRQVVRRPSEALLVVLGSVLGTALIVTSLVVGDSLDRSVRQTAYDVLGPIDEYVSSGTLAQAEQVSDRLQPLSEDPQVDGVLPVIGERVAATAGRPVARAWPGAGPSRWCSCGSSTSTTRPGSAHPTPPDSPSRIRDAAGWSSTAGSPTVSASVVATR